MIMDEDQFQAQNFRRKEIDDALSGHPADELLKVKVRGAVGESKWLSATPAQVAAIREILGGGDLVSIAEALSGQEF